MQEKAFKVILNLMLFWILTDLFSGIEIQEGVVGYLICGGIFGLVMLLVVPLIKFFTLPVKFITLVLISMMLGVIVFFVLNFSVPFIDFSDGEIVGFSNRYFSMEPIALGMMGNVLVGGLIAGVLSALLEWLLEEPVSR
jgi:uncharacterized membrane protein YvlD (DUF360 family)